MSEVCCWAEVAMQQIMISSLDKLQCVLTSSFICEIRLVTVVERKKHIDVSSARVRCALEMFRALAPVLSSMVPEQW